MNVRVCGVLYYLHMLYYLCRIYAGYNKSLRIFDVYRPGRDFKQHSTLQRDKEGQSGNSSTLHISFVKLSRKILNLT